MKNNTYFHSLLFLLLVFSLQTQQAKGQCSALATAPTGSITPSTLCQQGGTLTGSTAADATPLAVGYARLYLLVNTANGVIVDNQTTVAALTAPANATNADITYSVYSLVYTLAEFGTADITNGISTIIVGDANVITDNDGDPLLATPTVVSCMDLSPAATTTVTVNKKIAFEHDDFYICGNTSADISFSSDIAGLQLTWTASNTAGTVTGFANNGTPITINASPTIYITDVLDNTGSTLGTVTYIVTPQLGTCIGDTVHVNKKVLPTLNINISSVICNGTDYDVDFAITGGSGGFTVFNDAGTLNYIPDNPTGTVTGVPYGIINIGVDDAELCTNTTMTTVAFPATPTLTITNNICPATTGIISASGTGTIAYFTGVDAVTASANAINNTGGSATPPAYTSSIVYVCAVATDVNGCRSTPACGQTAPVNCTATCDAVAAAPTGSITPSTLCQQGGTLTGSTAADATPLAVGYARLYLLVNNANGVIVDNQTTIAALMAPANATNADITYSVYSLVYSLAEFGTADITNGTSTIIVGDANILTDNDGDPLLASPTVVSCMDLSPAAATTVTVSRSLTFIYDNFYICDNVSADISLSSDIAGLQVTWTASNTAGTVTGFANNAIPTSINNTPTIYITDVLNNIGSTLGTVTYIVTPQLGGCFGDTIHIDKDVLPEFGIAITSTTCNGSDYDVAFAITGGNSGFTVYNYDNSNVTAGTLNYTPDNTTGTVTGIPFGTINLLIDDVEGCNATTSTTISSPVVITSFTAGCSGGAGTGTLTTTATGVATLSYNIGTGSQTSGLFSSLADNTYTVTVTSGNGCTATSTATVNCTATCDAVAAAPTGSITPSTLCQQGGTLTGSTAADATPLAVGYARLYLLVNNANGVIVDNQTTIAALTAPANATNADITYSVYSLVYSLAEFGTADITNGTSTIIVGDANVLTDNDGDPLLASPTVVSCMDLSPAAATTVTVSRSLTFIYDNFYICDNVSADISLSSDIAGLQVTWTASNTAGTVTGFANNAIPTSINNTPTIYITDVLNNIGSTLGTVTYIVTPQLGGCFGDTIHIDKDVLPDFGIAITSTTCNGSDYDVAFAITGGNSGFTVYNYDNSNVTAGTLNYTPDNTTGTVTGIPFGTINLLIDDVEGCTATTTATVNTPPSAPLITVTNSTCTTACSPSGGSFTVTTACTNSTLTYYTDAAGTIGATTTPPVYAQSGPAQTIYYACVDLNACKSPIQTLTTVPGTCTTPTAGLNNNGPLTCTTTSVTLTGTGGGTYAYSGGSSTVSTPGTYTVTVTGANGCTSTATTEVMQDIVVPTAGLNNNGPLTCTTTSVTLTGTGGGTYAYSGGSSTVSTPGTYTVTVTGANGCTSTATTEVMQDIVVPTAGLTNDGPLTCTTTSVTLTGTGGGTYAYSGGSSTVSTPGTYTVTVTGANGCTSTATTEVMQDIVVPTAGLTNDGPLTCTTTSVTLTGTGGGTYAYSGGSSTVSTPGTYTVTVTGANGCTSTATTEVMQDIVVPTAGLTNDGPLTCLMPSVTLMGSGGGTYAYSGGSSTVSTPGTYTVTVTGANGCTSTATTEVMQDIVVPTAGLTNDGPLTCTTTSVTLTGTGGGTYAYSGGSSTVSTPGTYTVTVTGANGCTSTATTEVMQDIVVPTAGLNNNGPLTCTTTSVTLTGTGGGTYAYSGGSSTVSTPGTYTVTVTGANGCTSTATTEVMQDIVVPTAGLTNDGPLTCTTTSVTLTGTGGGTYAYSGGSSTVSTPGTYTVTVTGANGCTSIATTEVMQDIVVPTAGLNNNGPLTCTTTSVTLTGTGGGTYAYSGGSSTVSTPGTYTVTVTGANGCTSTATTEVMQDIVVPTAGLNNDGPLTCTTTSVTLTGTGGGTYAYSGGSSTVSTPGTYTVTVTGANGCTSTATTEVMQDIVVPTAGLNNNGPLTCTTTSVTLTGTGGGTYAYSGGSSTVSTPGTYTVTVTGANGCTSTATTEVMQDIVVPTAGLNNNGPLTCTTTSVTLTGTGGGTYAYSGGSSTVSTPGTYTVTVTGANGCTSTATTEVMQDIVVPTAGLNNNGPLTCTTTSVTLTGTGGGTYAYSGGSSTVSTPGTYTVTVTGANGCTSTATTEVMQDIVVPTAGLNNNGPLTCTTTSVTLTGTGGGTYAYSGGSSTVSTPGTYTVTVTGANGCTSTATTEVMQDIVVPTAGLNNNGPLTCTTTSVTLTGTGGGTYAYSGGSSTVSTPGTYTVTVTGANGCTSTATTEVMQDIVVPTAGLNNNGPLTCTTTSVTLTGTGGGTYAYSGGSSTVSTPGTYTVTVTGANGCTSTATTEVMQDIVVPTAGLNNNGPLTCTTTSVTLTGTGGGTYAYSGGSSTVSTPGTYTVTVTGANGCTSTATTEVMQDIATPIITSFTSGCSGGAGTGTLTTTATGVATLSYDIGTGSQTSGLFTGLADNTYTVTVTSGNGCTATSSATVSCVPICPVLTAAAPAVVINNQSTCTACTLGGGVVAAPLGSCPVGSTLQYSTDNGTLWSTTLPTYNQTTPITILTRCNCGIDNLVSSPTSTVTTAPGVCTPVSASITGTTNVACGAAISLSALPASAATYAWSGPNAYAANTASINRPGATAAMSGDYTVTVTAANGCTSTASTNVIVGACTGFTFNFGFFDPCICQNDATTLINGTFNELAGVTFVPQTIGSITSVPSDFVITVQSSTGTIGLTNGTILTYNPGFTRWNAPVFQHVDNIGYTATFEVTAAAGNQFGIAAGTVLGLVSGSNKCAYPDPIFSPAVPAAFCTSDAAFVLGANHTDAGPAGAATFYIDSSTPPATATGTPVTQISPVLLGVGAHTIRLDYLGGNNGNVSPDNGVTPAFPGCIQSVTAPTNVSICLPGCTPNSGAWAP